MTAVKTRLFNLKFKVFENKDFSLLIFSFAHSKMYLYYSTNSGQETSKITTDKKAKNKK